MHKTTEDEFFFCPPQILLALYRSTPVQVHGTIPKKELKKCFHYASLYLDSIVYQSNISEKLGLLHSFE